MSLSFVVLGVAVSAFGRAVGLNADDIAHAGAVLMILFGIVLLVPQASAVFSTATDGFAARADSGLDEVDRGSLTGQFVGGMLLGAVWSPCVGPTLGGAISLASQGESLLRATAIMLFFALGISTIILALGYGARFCFAKAPSRDAPVCRRCPPAAWRQFSSPSVLCCSSSGTMPLKAGCSISCRSGCKIYPLLCNSNLPRS